MCKVFHWRQTPPASPSGIIPHVGECLMLHQCLERYMESIMDSNITTPNMTVLGETLDLFHTPHKESYATVEVNSHRETWALQSKGFRELLEHQYYKMTGSL